MTDTPGSPEYLAAVAKARDSAKTRVEANLIQMFYEDCTSWRTKDPRKTPYQEWIEFLEQNNPGFLRRIRERLEKQVSKDRTS